MTTTFNKTTFIANFMNEYENNDIYDVKMLFDDIFDTFLQENTTEENTTLIKMFCTEEEIENMKNPTHSDYCICTVDNSLLYEYLYNLVEKAIIDSDEQNELKYDGDIEN